MEHRAEPAEKLKIHSPLTHRQLALRIALMMAGAALAATGLEIFLIPNQIIDGGVVGISIIISYLTGLPLGLFTFVINIPFLVVGYRQIGKTFTLSTLFANLCLSVGVSVLHPIPGLTHDMLLAAVFGGVIVGAGVGLIIRNGGSLDGTEIVAILLDRRIPFSIGEIIMFFNFFILSSAGFVFGWNKAMYSLIAYFIAFKTIDVVVEGIDESRAVMVVSDAAAELAEDVSARLGRGVTLLSSRGAYCGQESEVLYVVISRLEFSKLKQIVLNKDPDALVTVGPVETAGGKFKKRSIH